MITFRPEAISMIQEELAQVRPDKETVLTLGVFDGVHLGHQSLIGRAVELARQRGLLSGIITFRRHPLAVLAPEEHPTYLTTLEQRLALLERLGADVLLALTFTPEVAQLPARDFVALLHKYLKMRGLVVGPDFTLGRAREGTRSVLKALGDEMGFFVEVAPPLVLDDQVVSSTAIRRALARGDMLAAERFLGRPFGLQGPVVSGAARGQQLGYPTANLAVDSQHALPPDGVYAARAFVEGNGYAAAAYIGRRPTFGEGQRWVEVFLLDFQGDIYGREMKVDFLKRVRPDMVFPNAEALRAQIEVDVEQIRAVLGATKRG